MKVIFKFLGAQTELFCLYQHLKIHQGQLPTFLVPVQGVQAAQTKSTEPMLI